jgi:hypothetical protein
MKFEVTNRFTGNVQFTAEIEATDDMSYSFKLGLAVKWAIKSGAYLSGADLSGAYLSGAYLSGAYLSRAYLSGANLSGADLSRAHLSGADLSGAYLSGADLSGAYLSGADLSGADLSGAYLSGADLSGADLSGADLSGAYLSGADLSGADLSRAAGIAAELCTDLLILFAQPGPKLRAYKLVDSKYKSPIQSTGKLTYKIGARIEAKNVNADPMEHCGEGINVATLPWVLREWRDGWRVLLVEFDKADLICIPTATDGKFRVKAVDVIEELQLDFVKLGLKKAEQPAEAA